MKMVMVVVPSNSAERVLENLVNAGHSATYAETRGGMLRQSQRSLFIAVKAAQLEEVLEIIKQNCRTRVEMSTHPKEGVAGEAESSPVTADLGGAVAFVWDIDRIETF
ncbi:MAG TPA: hypothetical protein DF984_07770 [Anaerolineaceae bacterium]|jgi:uncharacterized protein YaaQ|nr:hypothetical protein [Anaerolineaceae bacterium]